MDIKIRKATIADLKDIQSLNLLLFKKEKKEYDKLLDLNWTFGEVGTNYFTNKITKTECCVLVAISKNKIIGYVCGGITKAEAYRKLPITAELDNMFVLEEYRSKGVGSMLYSEFMKWCKVNKVKKVRVQASAQNSLAIKFYKKNGFKEYTLILEHDF
jgi:diamine N-acetyltransferase